MTQLSESFIVCKECEKAAWQNGFRRKFDTIDGWAGFGSTTALGTIYLAASCADGPWYLALDHAGVIEELNHELAAVQGPGLARYAFETLGQLYKALPRVYQLAASLPDAPLLEFQHKTRLLPRSTEAERLVVQRIGQNIFRQVLMTYWQGRCQLTGIEDKDLLRASHIVPWKDCASDLERLDVHNGLLLSALWDVAFDRGLVTFYDDGKPKFSSKLSDTARNELGCRAPLQLTEKHRAHLIHHRDRVFIDS